MIEMDAGLRQKFGCNPRLLGQLSDKIPSGICFRDGQEGAAV
jgi:hypothetical protein